MEEHATAATAMLGLVGFRLLAVSVHGGEVEQAVETTETEAFCTGCGALARLHARRPSWVRDLPASGRPVVLVWVKRVWRCTEARCGRSTWTETSEAIRPRASLTERARADAARRVGRDGHSVAAVARDLGVSWRTVMTAVVDHGAPLAADPVRLAGVERVGVDETVFLAANHRHPALFVTGMVDVTRGRLLDVVEGRSGAALSRWLDARGAPWRDAVDVAVLDPFRGYKTALDTMLPDATIVLDAFHVTRLGFAALDDVRRRVQQQTVGHRGRKHDPLYRTRRVLRRGAERLTDHAWQRLLDGLGAGDNAAGEVTRAWITAQDLRRIYHAHDHADAARRLDALLIDAVFSGVPELERLAKTLSTWRAELLAYFTTGGASNGPTEGLNLLIKKIKRVGHGFRNFDNYRLRLLLHCGVTWNTPPTTPIRGRLPRLAA